MIYCSNCGFEYPVYTQKDDVWVCSECEKPVERSNNSKIYYVCICRPLGGKFFISRMTEPSYAPNDEYLHKNCKAYKMCGDEGFFFTKEEAYDILIKYYNKNFINTFTKEEFMI